MPFFSFPFSKSSPNVAFDDVDEPSLPGAWASVWSLHHQTTPDQSTNGQPHLRNERHHASISTVHESSINDHSNVQTLLPEVSLAKPVRDSIDFSDDLSLFSEEYHSFDSHGESETASLTAHESPADVGPAEVDDLNVLSPAALQSQHLSQHSVQPTLKGVPQEDTPNVKPFNPSCAQLFTHTSSHSSIQTPDLTFGNGAEMVYGHPRSSSCLLGIPEHSVTASCSSSRENSIYSDYPRSLTTDSATEEYDRHSVHSEQSSNANVGGVQLYYDRPSTSTIELQEPNQHTFPSQFSITSSLALESVSSPPDSFRVLDFAQPDGDNSWTLSLDPVTGAHELSSQASSSSLATSSSSVNTESTHDAPQISATPMQPSSPRYIDTSPPSNTAKAPPKRLFLRERVVSTPYWSQGSSPSVRDHSLSTPTRPSFGESIIATPTGGYTYGGPSRENVPRPELPSSPHNASSPGEDKSKNVLRKTKAVVTKLKSLFNTKPGKKKLLDPDYLPRSSVSPTGPLPSTSSPMSATFSPVNSSLHRTISPSSSVYQTFDMPRSVKLSTPSVAFSSMRDSNSARTRTNSNLNLEDKFAYEYHARPKTLDEIRSKRRFSLPNVLAGSGGRTTPSSSNYNIGNNNSMTRIGIRPVSTRRNTNKLPN